MIELTLKSLGWTPFFSNVFEREYEDRGYLPARISRNSKQIYHILCEEGEFVARVSGSFRHRANEPSDYPAVGDWVAVSPRSEENEAEIHALLPRKTVFSRQAVAAAGTESQSREQIVAANVDLVLIVAALDGSRGFNLRRIERYLTLARSSGATPAVIVNKIDLCKDPAPAVKEAEGIAGDAPVFALSALNDEAVEPVRQLVGEGTSVVLLGPSGIGKSTLINAIAQEEIMETGEVRDADQRGRHTTTWSELNLIERGGILIDTPGLRDVQIWANQEAIEETFAEISNLTLECKFRDCGHTKEPGCAIQLAIKSGELDLKRFESYLKQKREANEAALRREREVKKKHAPSPRRGKRGGRRRS